MNSILREVKTNGFLRYNSEYFLGYHVMEFNMELTEIIHVRLSRGNH